MDLTQNLNMIINSAGSWELVDALDTAVLNHVTGPLMLLKLAEESPMFECFLQMSTAFVNADR